MGMDELGLIWFRKEANLVRFGFSRKDSFHSSTTPGGHLANYHVSEPGEEIQDGWCR